jgi:L-ornithine Nalpha-acyltransferase
MWSLQGPFALDNAIAFLPRHSKTERVKQSLRGLTPTLGRIGALEVRLATTKKEIRQAQRLRFKVFFEEGGASADRKMALMRRDICAFDRVCDHLLVIDHAARGKRLGIVKPKVVGTYRLLRQDVAQRNFGFYTAREFDIAPMLARHSDKHFLELGRSCVSREYRTKRTLELLWHGIWVYVLHHRVDVMIGCASLEGTDPQALALPLSFLHHRARGDQAYHARARSDRYVDMQFLAESAIDGRKALNALPPLLKGYLRVGAMIGEGAVVDHQFGTTDVLVIMPIASIEGRYIAHFGPSAERLAA